MVVTSLGLSGTALLLGPSGSRPTYMAIGTGSKAENANVTTMGSLAIQNAFTSIYIATQKKITWTNDFSTIQMSGLNWKEFALLTGSPGTEIWHYVNYGNGIQFDGSNELRIELLWEVF